jgi:tRNA (mo5U34)-methyltransferase
MPFRRVAKIGSVELLISIDDQLASRLRTSRWWWGAKDRAPRTMVLANAPTTLSPDKRELLRRVSEIEWYHTIDLGNGIRTPGQFDHQPYLHEYPIPRRLDGKRVLDVATYDGFWAFEFERRGASEVVAIDIDRVCDADLAAGVREAASPEVLATRTGAGFHTAKQALGSNVRRELINVYDLSPARLGRFDFVFCGDLLLHLMAPVKALQAIYSVVGGEALFVDCFTPDLPDAAVEYRGGMRRCVWWSFSRASIERMIRDAGFHSVTLLNTFKFGHAHDKSWIWHAAFRAVP